MPNNILTCVVYYIVYMESVVTASMMRWAMPTLSKKRRTIVEDTNLSETLYTACMLDEYVKNMERTYWASHGKFFSVAYENNL